MLLLFIAALPFWLSQSCAQTFARLGVVISNLTQIERGTFGLFNGGVYVVVVKDDTSADRAGILSKDVIYELDGKPVQSVDNFLCRIAQRQPGDAIKLGIIRNHARLTITLKLGVWSTGPSRLEMPAECSVVDNHPDTASHTTQLAWDLTQREPELPTSDRS